MHLENQTYVIIWPMDPRKLITVWKPRRNTNDRSSLYMYDILPLTFKYLRCFPPERLVEDYNRYISWHGRTHLASGAWIHMNLRYNIEDCPGWLPVCAIWIKLDNLGFFWSHIRLSKGHQEIQMSYFGSLCDNNTLRSCAKDVLKSNHQLDSLKQNGSCTPITYITKQSVRDCKPPPCNTNRNPDLGSGS